MRWKPEYVGLAPLFLLGLAISITAVRISLRRELPALFRTTLVIHRFLTVLFLVFAAVSFFAPPASRDTCIWLCVFFLGLRMGASRYCIRVLKNEQPRLKG